MLDYTMNCKPKPLNNTTSNVLIVSMNSTTQSNRLPNQYRNHDYTMFQRTTGYENRHQRKKDTSYLDGDTDHPTGHGCQKYEYETTRPKLMFAFDHCSYNFKFCNFQSSSTSFVEISTASI